LISGIGTDIIEVSRMEHQLAQEGKPAFRDRVFTEAEIRFSEEKASRGQHYAARFAAKEAFFKALGTGWRDGLQWKDVEIVNDPLGRPVVNLYGKANQCASERGITRIHVSLSHLKELATAVVILEKTPKENL
jgi:holo-[acyl-carrier protein] synthase